MLTLKEKQCQAMAAPARFPGSHIPAPLSCPWHYDQRTHGTPPWGVLATHCGRVDLFPSTVLPCPKNLIPNALVIKHIQVPP